MAFGIESAIETCFAGSRAPSWTSNRGGIAGAGRREPRVEAGNCCLPWGLRWQARSLECAVDHGRRGLVRSWCMTPKEIAHAEVGRRLLGCRGDRLGRRWLHFRWRCQFLRPEGWNAASRCCLVIGVLYLGNGPSLGDWSWLSLRLRPHRGQTRPIVGFAARWRRIKSFLFEADKLIFIPYQAAAYLGQLELCSSLAPQSRLCPNSEHPGCPLGSRPCELLSEA